MKKTHGLIVLGLVVVGCSSDDTSGDGTYEHEIVSGMHASLLREVEDLQAAAEALQKAAPGPSGRGWDVKQDQSAVAAMRAAWGDARTAYEHIEGALAPLFPEIDFAIDARYDDFLTRIGPKGDSDPFDGEGVTGMHAVERILWADEIPARV